MFKNFSNGAKKFKNPTKITEIKIVDLKNQLNFSKIFKSFKIYWNKMASFDISYVENLHNKCIRNESHF